MVMMVNIGAFHHIVDVMYIHMQNQMLGGKVYSRYQMISGAIIAPAMVNINGGVMTSLKVVIMIMRKAAWRKVFEMCWQQNYLTAA